MVGIVFARWQQCQHGVDSLGAPQVVQSGIQQGGEDVAQPWAAQRVPALIPAGVFHSSAPMAQHPAAIDTKPAGRWFDAVAGLSRYNHAQRKMGVGNDGTDLRTRGR